MSGNRGPLDEDGITDTDVLTTTTVADAGPVTNTGRKAKPKKLTKTEALDRARNRAGNWLTRINSSMSNVELLGWDNPKLSTFVSEVPAEPEQAFGAWTNSSSRIFVNYGMAPRRPDLMDAWLIAVLKHESIHVEWFRGDSAATPPRPAGHPATFLIGLAHEKETYQGCARWLEKGGAAKLIADHVGKPVPSATMSEIKRIARDQRAGCRLLDKALKHVMKLPSAQREQEAFTMFSFSAGLSQDTATAMKQLYNES